MSEDNSELEVVKHWLKARLVGLVNVQNCMVTPAKSLIVNTWTGVIVNIHLIDAPTRTRTIRHILQESTDIGIGAMFILKADLIPSQDVRFEPKEWVLALQAVNHERIYLYSTTMDGPKITQVHLEPVGTTGEWVARYGPEVKIDQLRYFRMSVRPRYIKGDWQVADFGLNTFWKDPFSARRTEYRRATDHRETTWRAWSQTTWDQKPFSEEIPAPEIPMPARSRLELSYELLEVNRDATRDEVKAAFRKRAIALHPDTSTLPKDEAEKKFRELNDAYEFIKSNNKWP